MSYLPNSAWGFDPGAPRPSPPSSHLQKGKRPPSGAVPMPLSLPPSAPPLGPPSHLVPSHIGSRPLPSALPLGVRHHMPFPPDPHMVQPGGLLPTPPTHTFHPTSIHPPPISMPPSSSNIAPPMNNSSHHDHDPYNHPTHQHSRHKEEDKVQTKPISSSQPPNSAQMQQSLQQQTIQQDKKREREKKERDEREAKRRKEKEKADQAAAAKKKEDEILALATMKPPTNLLKKESEFLCKVKFRNELPDVPFDPKLLVYPFDPLRYVCYSSTSLEKKYKYSLLSDPNTAIPLNLVDYEIYRPPLKSSQPELAEEDKHLLTAPLKGPASTPNKDGTDKENPLGSALGDKHRPTNRKALIPAVPWLRKTEYISSDYDQLFTRRVEKSPLHIPEKSGPTERRDQNRMDEYQSVIEKVEESFEEAKGTPVHPTDPSIRPKEILPVFPDFALWGNNYVQVAFDGDPRPPEGGHLPRAFVKAFSADKQGQFVTLMLPQDLQRVEKKKKISLENQLKHCERELSRLVNYNFNQNKKNKKKKRKKETNDSSDDESQSDSDDDRDQDDNEFKTVEEIEEQKRKKEKEIEQLKQEIKLVEEQQINAGPSDQIVESLFKDLENKAATTTTTSNDQTKEGEGIRYDWIREYAYEFLPPSIGRPSQDHELYVFAFRDGSVYYNELNSRVTLKSKATKTEVKTEKIVLKFREPTAAEEEQRKKRLEALEKD